MPNKERPTLFTLLFTKQVSFAVNYMRLLIIAASLILAAQGVFAQPWTPWQVQTPRQRLDVTGKGETVVFSQVDLVAGMTYRVHAEGNVAVGDGGTSDARYYFKIIPVSPTLVPVSLKMRYDVAAEDWFNSSVAPAQQAGYQSSHVYDALVTSRGVPLAFRFFDRESAPSSNGYYDDNSGHLTIEVSRETPGIAVKYDTIDFGTVAVGKSKTLLDSIQGYGKGYQLENVSLTGAAAMFSVVSERTVPFGLKDATNEFAFTFSPTTTGQQIAYFHMISSSAFGTDKDRIIVLIGNGGKAVVTSLTDTLDFGTIAVGSTKTLDAILRNTGNMDAEVQSVIVTQPTMPFSTNTLPVTVPEASQAGLAVTFAPPAIGPYFAAIDAKLDDGSTIRFYAKGNGGGAMVTSLTDTLDFGTIGVGTTKTLDATFENTGLLDAQVVSIQVTPTAAPFSSSALPLALVKATQAPLPITFAPPAVGPYFAAIDAILDDGSSVRFYAKGNGGGAMVTSLTDTLDFGTIGVGTTKTLNAILQNTGFLDAQVQSAQVTPTTAPFSASGMPLAIVTAAQASLPVTFAPLAVGPYFAIIDANLDNGSSVRFYAKGNGGGATVMSLTDTLDFGTIPVGTTKTLDAILRNTGLVDAQVQSALVTPATMPFTAGGFPIPVVTSSTAPLPVTFSPTAIGLYFATIDVRIDDGSTVRFYAKGAAGQGKPFFTADTLYFDTVIIGLSRVLTSTFRNKEDIPGTGGPLSVTHSTNSNPEFSVVGNPGPYTKTIGSGEVYTVTFAPTVHLPNYGLHSGEFTLHFTDQGPKTLYFFGYDHLALDANLKIDSFYYVVAGDEVVVRQVLTSDLSGTLSPVRQLSQTITYDPTYFDLLDVQKGTIIAGQQWTLNRNLVAGSANITISSTTARFGPGGELLKLRFRAKPNAPLGAYTYLPQIALDFGGFIEPLAFSQQGKITVSDLCTPVHVVAGGTPGTYIEQNSPNPFTHTTRIRFSVGESAEPQHTSLRIYDATGRVVKTIVDDVKASGYYAVNFDGSDLAPGVYTCLFRSGDHSMTRMMVINR